MDDVEAVTRCLAGDAGAFEDIVTRYQPKLLALAWAVLGNREEARDAVQDAFIQAYLHLADYNPARSFKNWVTAIAYHGCLNRKRRDKLFQAYVRNVADRADSADSPKPSGPGCGLEDLERHFHKLALKERSALLLSLHEGRTAAEIAEVMGCRESTARVFLFRAKRKLRKICERSRDV
jgi:RNA polymerase sigma-70 factor (ECF subfamily)